MRFCCGEVGEGVFLGIAPPAGEMGTEGKSMIVSLGSLVGVAGCLAVGEVGWMGLLLGLWGELGDAGLVGLPCAASNGTVSPVSDPSRVLLPAFTAVKARGPTLLGLPESTVAPPERLGTVGPAWQEKTHTL